MTPITSVLGPCSEEICSILISNPRKTEDNPSEDNQPSLLLLDVWWDQLASDVALVSFVTVGASAALICMS